MTKLPPCLPPSLPACLPCLCHHHHHQSINQLRKNYNKCAIDQSAARQGRKEGRKEGSQPNQNHHQTPCLPRSASQTKIMTKLPPSLPASLPAFLAFVTKNYNKCAGKHRTDRSLNFRCLSLPPPNHQPAISHHHPKKTQTDPTLPPLCLQPNS